MIGWVNRVRQRSRSGTAAPAEIRDIRLLLDEMRLFKSTEELQVMRRAAEISGGAHRRAMQNTRPGMSEYEVEAELLHEFRRHGAQAPAYTSIVAGGANACVLHYVENNTRLKAGELLLIDAGCELTATPPTLRVPFRWTENSTRRNGIYTNWYCPHRRQR